MWVGMGSGHRRVNATMKVFLLHTNGETDRSPFFDTIGCFIYQRDGLFVSSLLRQLRITEGGAYQHNASYVNTLFGKEKKRNTVAF